jgi:hypothetical protein
MYTGTERRRIDLPGRMARVTWPARHAVGGIVTGFPCNVIGHHWVEIPMTVRRSSYGLARHLRFKCSRCRMTTGA